jgi:hypothetical protein
MRNGRNPRADMARRIETFIATHAEDGHAL